MLCSQVCVSFAGCIEDFGKGCSALRVSDFHGLGFVVLRVSQGSCAAPCEQLCLCTSCLSFFVPLRVCACALPACLLACAYRLRACLCTSAPLCLCRHEMSSHCTDLVCKPQCARCWRQTTIQREIESSTFTQRGYRDSGEVIS